MISLMPEELIKIACHLVCYGFASVSAVFAVLFMPRW
ncbi:hypothetical protein HG15A2_22590 [Adhaeretor mobilis]|uniref:Uncharacterized protein n=1 Tax=Adhaeretor mobilis TaxID=1930276 RepID=A0A517MVS2_9BACT|nr:hypothetical protein HG15A2_22590 [Adhaeretor mobilis]